MKLFLLLLVLFGALAVPQQALARGGHVGTFQRISRDPATDTRIVIEFYVPPFGRKGGWSKVIAYDDGKQWVRLEKPIPVVGNDDKLQGKLPAAPPTPSKK